MTYKITILLMIVSLCCDSIKRGKLKDIGGEDIYKEDIAVLDEGIGKDLPDTHEIEYIDAITEDEYIDAITEDKFVTEEVLLDTPDFKEGLDILDIFPDEEQPEITDIQPEVAEQDLQDILEQYEIEEEIVFECITDDNCKEILPDPGQCKKLKCKENKCMVEKLDENTLCDDKDICTKDDKCVDGECKGKKITIDNTCDFIDDDCDGNTDEDCFTGEVVLLYGGFNSGGGMSDDGEYKVNVTIGKHLFSGKSTDGEFNLK